MVDNSLAKPKERLLLLHGWDWKNYPRFNNRDPWSNRSEFVNELRKQVETDSPSLPGFGGSTIPNRPWTLDDYADWLEATLSTNDYTGILGYSFGGAVLARWAQRRITISSSIRDPKKWRLFFVSPAIVRKYEHTNTRFSRINRMIGKLLPSVATLLRHLYLCYWINNEYYRFGGGFQRKTYSNIVGLNLSQELNVILRSGLPFHMIYGADDTATPPTLLRRAIPQIEAHLSIINGGGHDIANSHTQELTRIIFAHLKK